MRMIRIALVMLCSIGVCSTSLAQQRHFGRINGTPVSVILTSDQLIDAPTWLNETEDEPPLSVGKAIERAKSAVAKEYPTLKDKKWSVSVVLREESDSVNSGHHFTDSDGTEYYKANTEEWDLTTPKWVYWIRLTWTPMMGNGLTDQSSPNIPVAVLMDGSVVLPTRIRKPLAEIEFSTHFRRKTAP